MFREVKSLKVKNEKEFKLLFGKSGTSFFFTITMYYRCLNSLAHITSTICTYHYRYLILAPRHPKATSETSPSSNLLHIFCSSTDLRWLKWCLRCMGGWWCRTNLACVALDARDSLDCCHVQPWVRHTVLRRCSFARICIQTWQQEVRHFLRIWPHHAIFFN